MVIILSLVPCAEGGQDDSSSAGSGRDADRGARARSVRGVKQYHASSQPKGDCPTTAIPVVVSVDQWGDIVDQLAGDCGDVTTVFKSTSADPHDYEPTPADNAKFTGAKLVVENGLDYDPWADKAVATLDTKPAVVNGGKVVGLENGDNPHIWYGPATYTRSRTR